MVAFGLDGAAGAFCDRILLVAGWDAQGWSGASDLGGFDGDSLLLVRLADRDGLGRVG